MLVLFCHGEAVSEQEYRNVSGKLTEVHRDAELTLILPQAEHVFRPQNRERALATTPR